jgi:hypothetical protein
VSRSWIRFNACAALEPASQSLQPKARACFKSPRSNISRYISWSSMHLSMTGWSVRNAILTMNRKSRYYDAAFTNGWLIKSKVHRCMYKYTLSHSCVFLSVCSQRRSLQIVLGPCTSRHNLHEPRINVIRLHTALTSDQHHRFAVRVRSATRTV